MASRAGAIAQQGSAAGSFVLCLMLFDAQSELPKKSDVAAAIAPLQVEQAGMRRDLEAQRAVLGDVKDDVRSIQADVTGLKALPVNGHLLERIERSERDIQELRRDFQRIRSETRDG